MSIIEIIKNRLNVPMAKHLVKDSEFIKMLAEISSDCSTAQILYAIENPIRETLIKSKGKQPITGNDLIASMRELKERILSQPKIF